MTKGYKNTGNQQSKNKEGKVTVDYIPSKERKNRSDDDEYVDYEEVD